MKGERWEQLSRMLSKVYTTFLRSRAPGEDIQVSIVPALSWIFTAVHKFLFLLLVSNFPLPHNMYSKSYLFRAVNHPHLLTLSLWFHPLFHWVTRHIDFLKAHNATFCIWTHWLPDRCKVPVSFPLLKVASPQPHCILSLSPPPLAPTSFSTFL
jgi:hypothetical protein